MYNCYFLNSFFAGVSACVQLCVLVHVCMWRRGKGIESLRCFLSAFSGGHLESVPLARENTLPGFLDDVPCSDEFGILVSLRNTEIS